MAIVLVMLSVIFAMVLHFTRQELVQESVSMLRSVAADPLKLNWPGSSGARLPYFTVRITPFGDVHVSGSSYYDLTDAELLSGLIEKALAGEENTGLIGEYNLRYYRVYDRALETIVFADVSSETATMRSLLRLCLLIGAGSLGVFIVVSLLLARWAVRPVEKAWDQQKQFVSDASHELKTPLTVILTNAELLQDPDYPEADKKTFTESILTMARQMRGLVESLLELARADNGAARTEFTELDLSALVTDAVLPFEAVFYEKGLTLLTDVEEGIRVKGSERLLRQAAEILLDNAAKYADPGQVELSLKKQGRGALLSVTTPGEPLSPQERRDVFKRFYRADKVRSMDHSYGLGLPIAESIVTEHGGKIWCESGEGRNAFFIRLAREA